ncbi:hypothetical protein TRIUR3_32732 [Triticum urartu]|uniref:AIPP2-like SPOC-like domain-containing protein n=1 Tax=Triticum urartu TaxID=4572 RepID=M7YZT3_TRIUA|nr:hypothetical protein TRIUR3_32732 [Triticum urartu]
MGSRRQHGVNHFGPILRKPSIRKAPGKLKKKCLEQLKRTQQSFRRGDDNLAKRPQQNKVATKHTLCFPFNEPSHSKPVSRPNVSSRSSWPNKGMASPREDVEKSKPSFSRTLTQKASPSCAMHNSGIDSLPKNTIKFRPCGNILRPNNGMGSSARNVESYSRLNNVEAPRSKNTKMPGSSYSRPNDGMAPQSMKASPFSSGSNCVSGPLARKDDSNSTFDISKKSYPSSLVCNSRKEDHPIVMEASNSNLALKGKKVMEDILPNLGINCDSLLPSKNLSSHQTVEASCMVNSIDGYIQLDIIKCKSSLSKDGRTDVYKSKSKRMESLLEEKFEARGVARLTESMGISIKLDNESTSLGKDERGIIKIGSGKFVSLAAHLSTKYCEKVWKLSRSLEPVVEVTKLSRLEAWPKSFEASRPTDDNIALYLLPMEMRQDADMDQLVKEVMENDMVLRAIVAEAEMLIFPSILLPEQHQTFQGKPYLWAVFKHRIVEEEQHGKGRCAQEKGKQLASLFSVGEGLNIDAGLEASEEPEMQGMEPEQNPKLARPNAPSPTTKAPTTAAATMSANHCQDHSNMAAPTGALFGFVVQRTPRLEQLIQEMQREGAVMVAMQGQMIGPGIGLCRQ